MKFKTVEKLMVKYPMIKPYMLISIIGYRDEGQYQGSFGEALLSNDLMGAFRASDDGNIAAMHEWAKFLANDMPAESYGSPENYNAWLKMRGLNGSGNK